MSELTYHHIEDAVSAAFRDNTYEVIGVWGDDLPVRYSDPRINVVTNALRSAFMFDLDNPADMARFGSVIVQALDNFSEVNDV